MASRRLIAGSTPSPPAPANVTPVHRPAGPDDRDTLLARYRRLVDVELPAAARSGGWVLRENHCFGRVLLDHAVGRCWYEVLDRRAGAAYRQLDDDTLAGAVRLAERLLAEGDPLLRQLDASSLRWRGKRPKTNRGQARTHPEPETRGVS